MKYKTLFRLGLKLVGVMFVAWGVQGLATMGGQYLVARWSGGPSAGMPLDVYLAFLPSAVFSFGVGLYLFFGGSWIVDKAIPSNRPYCPNCGYDLTGAASKRCTECGTPFRAEDVRPPCVDDDSPTQPPQGQIQQPERTE